MKLSKTLLGAILVGITLNTTTSCKKEKQTPKSEQEAKQKAAKIDPCPACGMG